VPRQRGSRTRAMRKPSALKYEPWRLTKLGARVGITTTFAILGAELCSYHAPPAMKGVFFAISGAIWAVLYWRLWSWVMSLRRKK
jgi:hypothetical protein